MNRVFSLACIALCGVSLCHAQERKNLSDVSLTALGLESERRAVQGENFDVISWILPEYWEATFLQDGSMAPAEVNDVMETFRQVSVLGVVQATVSTFDATSFLDRASVGNGLTVEYRPLDGETKRLTPIDALNPDWEFFLAEITPVLAASMGNLGENFHFFVFNDVNQDGTRILSPYEFGELYIELAARTPESPIELTIEFPMDALFIPRVCPNGKPAHVTWRYCPWDGIELRD